MAMEQQHRRPRPAPPPEQLQTTAANHALRESLEHADSLADATLRSANRQGGIWQLGALRLLGYKRVEGEWRDPRATWADMGIPALAATLCGALLRAAPIAQGIEQRFPKT